MCISTRKLTEGLQVPGQNMSSLLFPKGTHNSLLRQIPAEGLFAKTVWIPWAASIPEPPSLEENEFPSEHKGGFPLNLAGLKQQLTSAPRVPGISELLTGNGSQCHGCQQPPSAACGWGVWTSSESAARHLPRPEGTEPQLTARKPSSLWLKQGPTLIWVVNFPFQIRCSYRTFNF